MNLYENNALFWQKLDTLYYSSDPTIVRRQGERHPEYYNLIYPVDYGYLMEVDHTTHKLSYFRGSRVGPTQIGAIVVIADILQKETEIKLLINCTEEEQERVLVFLNQTEFQKGVLLCRTDEVPAWAVAE